MNIIHDSSSNDNDNDNNWNYNSNDTANNISKMQIISHIKKTSTKVEIDAV